ncbi:hypothetical protein [Propionivibrio limicola]|uniref:hypothetical protein n=1 Tax=Propionivibrio limicola TaxID=167645 RepID=UPI001290F0F5|nr:hypothetical protein [Propionivibrio limicola]
MSTKKFLSTLQPHAGYGMFVEYDIDGTLWNGYDLESHDYMSHHPKKGVILNIRGGDDDKFHWEYSLLIAEGVYVRHVGVAETVPEASEAALAYQPTVHVFDWIGETTWYETDHNTMTAAIDGEEAKIRKTGFAKDESKYQYAWSREWSPASAVLDAAGGIDHSLSGHAPTLEQALIAVMEAPERLKLACVTSGCKLTQASD